MPLAGLPEHLPLPTRYLSQRGMRSSHTKQVAGGGSSYAVGYVYDVNRGLPVVLVDEVSGANPPPRRTYVWGAAGLAYAVAGTGAGTPVAYHADGLGSVRALTDAGGQVVQIYRSDEFGVPAQEAGTQSQRFQWAGEERDENGFVFLRARHFLPDLGRFLQRDPLAGSLAGPQSLNRYAYVQNNSATFVDPSGLVRIELRYRHLQEPAVRPLPVYHAYIIVTDSAGGGSQMVYSVLVGQTANGWRLRQIRSSPAKCSVTH